MSHEHAKHLREVREAEADPRSPSEVMVGVTKAQAVAFRARPVTLEERLLVLRDLMLEAKWGEADVKTATAAIKRRDLIEALKKWPHHATLTLEIDTDLAIDAEFQKDEEGSGWAFQSARSMVTGEVVELSEREQENILETLSEQAEGYDE